jgi:TonB-linked SusC/RagA family outer membrane protein
MRKIRWLLGVMLAVAFAPGALPAQEPAVITGRVTNAAGAPEASVAIRIDALTIGTTTAADGTYRLPIPASRVRAGQQVRVTASRVGLASQSRTVTLNPGASLTQNFQLGADVLQLQTLVATGAGTTATAVQIGSSRSHVSGAEISRSNEANVVEALAAKAPNVEVTQSSGEPGSSSYIRMRGTRTISGNGQPLFVVDGVPVDNSSYSTSNFNPLDELGSGEISGTTQSNRAVDINPSDIESVEILKGAAAGAIYGARAGQGVVLITTKSGRPGATRYTLRTSYSADNVNHKYPLQTTWGLGRNGILAGEHQCDDATLNTSFCTRSWGANLRTLGVPSFDHASEAYQTGHTSDSDMSISGGNQKTTFYLSLSHLDDQGVFKGPSNSFQRSTVRLKGTHFLADNFNIGGNFSYADSRGDFVQRGNNVNGLQLGLLRTPPNFNNQPFIDPATGQHRSFRLQHPNAGTERATRGFDNPFWALFEDQNTSQVGRMFGNVNANYIPVSWLTLNYTLGADYSTDERLEGAPIGSSDVSSEGRVTEGKIVNYELDHNLTGTAKYRLSSAVDGSFTLGQNLNSRNNRILANVGRTLIAPQPFKLSNTVTRDNPIDNETVIHNSSFFGQATFDLWDQVFLTAAARNDGSSTFSEEHRRSWYPKASISWDATRMLGESDYLGLLKLRAAYGETGQEPLPYLTSSVYSTTLLSGVTQGTGLSPTQNGFGGLASSLIKGATDLRPERTKELELGFDFNLFRNFADASFTYYNARTEDVILNVALPPSTGFTQQAQNAGVFRNRGIEVSLNLHPIQRKDLAWDVGFQYGRNKSRVLELTGVDFVALDGTSTITPFAVAKKGEEVGVFYDFGVVRCGESSPDAVAGLEAACAGKPKGAMYIGADGFPVADEQQRVIGNPNPDWTGSIRSGLTFRQFEFSGLLDIKHGGVIYNGTRGALLSYGTHKETEERATCTASGCTGNEKVFGSTILPGPVAGPGAGMSVPIGANWYRDGLAPCPFSGVSELCMEDGGYVKLRELSVAYNFASRWLASTVGINSLNLRLAGRNLHTWTKYSGYDPETNLGGSVQKTRGMDYFNMPQTRSFVVSVSLSH